MSGDMRENRAGNRTLPFILAILLVGLSSSYSIHGDSQSELKHNNAQFTSESMNYPGSTIGSIYSQSTITASYSYTCVIIFDNTMKCWGQRGESPSTGYLGDGQINGNSFTPAEVLLDDEQGNSSAIETASYGHHSCAVMADYSLKCWGNDWNGQVGHNVSGGWHSTPFPTTMPNGLTAIQSAAGLHTSCAIMDDYSLWCWGDNDPQGQVGIGNTSQGNIAIPQQIDLPPNRTAISVVYGHDYGCAILDNGDGMCWGDNQGAQLGDGTTENRSSPTLISLVPQSRRLVAIDVGFQTTCGILDNGSVLCWGRNDVGQFGDGTLTNYSSTVSRYAILPVGRVAVSISVGQYHACAILDNGDAFCWGSNELGQLGDGSTTDRSTPSRVSMPEGSVVSTISAGNQHTCAILSNASVYCWGDNSDGQLGIGEGLVGISPSFVDLGPNEHAMLTERDHDDDGVISIFDSFPYGCPAGTYSTNGTCLDTNPGYFSDGNPPYAQIPCEPGQFQPLTGQDSCILATPGHFVGGESWTNQTECSPGTFQPNYGEDTCLPASIGYFVPESGATRQVACSPGSYQNQASSTICVEASPGHFVSGGAAGNQTACDPGTYQNLAGQITCLEVEIGFQAPNQGSTSQEQCQQGTFSSQTGQSQCTEASPGYFVSGVQQEAQYPCQPGAYQPSSGQGECLLASPGNYTDSEASVSQTPCPIGNYQPLAGQASCLQADPGNYSLDGATSQSPCSPGTYQPNPGNGECIDAEPGHYVDLDGAVGQIPCPEGQFQGEAGNEGCLDSPPGEIASPDGTSTTPCSPGTYKPENQNSCIQSSPGNFVNQSGATSQTPCDPGTFSDSPGETDCELASPGSFVPEGGASSQTPCSKGEFQSYGGQSSCNQAMPGHHVPQEGALSQTSCRPGNFQPEEGQEECLPADPGNFVPSSGSTSQSPCQPGSFQSSPSSTVCQPSDPGHFVEEAGAVEQMKCPSGYEQELTGQTACEKIQRPLWLTILMFGVPAIVLGTMAALYIANKKKKGAGGRGKAYMYSEDLRRRR